MADKSALGTAEWTMKKRKTGEEQLYLRLGLEEHLHPRRVCAGTAGLNSIGVDKASGTALRHWGAFPYSCRSPDDINSVDKTAALR